jgi:hypothetical protein
MDVALWQFASAATDHEYGRTLHSSVYCVISMFDRIDIRNEIVREFPLTIRSESLPALAFRPIAQRGKTGSRLPTI